MAVHRLHRSILSLKSWLFTPATKAEGALLYGESTGFDRTGAPRVPGRAHGGAQGESPAVSLKNLKTGETNMKDRCIHPNASTSHSAFHNNAVGTRPTREVWSAGSRT